MFVRAGDLFHDVFTLKEILEYEAMFRVRGPQFRRTEAVERVIREFELEKIQNVRIDDFEKKKIPNI